MIAVVVVIVVAMRVVDEAEVEAGATAQDFEAGEAEVFSSVFFLMYTQLRLISPY